MNTPGTSNIEMLLTFSVRAYRIGESDSGKQRTQEDVFNAVRFSLRSGYNLVVWQAYKSGGFAAGRSDK